jgi:hypothetical protein
MGIDVENLKKIPKSPAARLLADASTKLETKLDLPVVASVEDYLTALDEKGEVIDILRLLAVALPRRESVWWACLAAADLCDGDDEATPSLRAAKAWVYKPDEENREAVRVAMEAADNDDDTVYCAMAAYYGDGTAGAGELADTAAPPPAVSGAVIAQTMLAIRESGQLLDAGADLMIRRALDIAKGGNGKVELPVTQDAKEEE